MSDLNTLDVNNAVLQANSQRVERNMIDTKNGLKIGEQSDEELKNASEQFEALLLNFMIKEMRSTVPESGLFERSMAEEIFTGMLDEQMAGKMAKNGDVGLSRLIFDQLKGNR